MVCLAQGTLRTYLPPSISQSLHMEFAPGPCSITGALLTAFARGHKDRLHFLSCCSLEPPLSSVLCPLFICVRLSCMWLLLPPFSVLISVLRFSLLSFWPLGSLLPTALDLSGTLGVAGENDAVKCQVKSRWNCMHVWVTSGPFLWTSLIQLKQLWKHLIFTFWPLKGA